VKRAVVIALAALAAAGAPSGEAKNLSLVRICGTSGCSPIEPAIPVPGGERSEAPAVQPYYVLTAADRSSLYFVSGPAALSGAHVAGPGAWGRLTSPSGLRALAGRLRPFPAPRLSDVRVDGRRVSRPAAYAALLGPLPRVAARWDGELLVPIDVRWAAPNPWSAEASYLEYIPEKRLLIRLDGYFRVPESLAATIERDRP
jgi:hypothetical protein